MQWIKDIETAKSIDDLITPRSMLGRTDVPDNDMLDAMMTSAWRKLFDKQTHFRKKVIVEEQRAQNNHRFLRGRQIASMIYEYFPSGVYDGVQGLSDLFSIRLHNNNIQDFDPRWEQAILSTSDPRSDKILEGLHKSKLQDSTQLQAILAPYNQETIQSGGEPDCHRLRKYVKLHIDQTLKNKNFKFQNETVERGAVTKCYKGNKPFVDRRVGECLQWKANGSCSK